ncbi:AAA family ATPase [Echinicola soli]|uniref:AAA family ATPase n=1 Tax=Echinicola soli TaxID=2591634 RepID=A0A514CGN9_9BACT|nr:AAA family ATPase [Echinicola soli]QDH78989.1 AAA family ATPase [Echinicola soli]
MITYIKINGFKSFHNFEMEFTPFTIIAGANASGKSNLFDALMLLSRLAEVDLRTAFSEQRGNAIELFTMYDEGIYSKTMDFTVEMLLNRKVKDKWGGEENLNNTRLRYNLSISRKENRLGFEDLFITHESLEKIRPLEDKWQKKFEDASIFSRTLRAGGSREPFIKTTKEGEKVAIKIRQDGKQGGKVTPADTISQTVLGGIVNVDFPHVYGAKEEMLSWKFLQLNPKHLSEPTNQEPGIKDEITSSGANLASTLYRVSLEDGVAIREISRKLNSFLPNFTRVNIIDDKPNRQYIIKLKGVDGKEYSSRVLSEGTLRLLALCVLEQDRRHTGLLCFEEPENGIHPYRLQTMLDLLKDLTADFKETEMPLRQVIVNTHSPVLINEIIKWNDSGLVSVNFSEIRTNIVNTEYGKKKLNATRILPVIKDISTQETIGFSSADRKLTIATVKKYLETVDFDESTSLVNKL